MPKILRDTDGFEHERRGIVSAFSGPPPEIRTFANAREEADNVPAASGAWLGEGIAAHEIGVFGRTPQLIPRARASVPGIDEAAGIVTSPMSLAKGLEFRALVVMACDEGTLPLDERVAAAADEFTPRGPDWHADAYHDAVGAHALLTLHGVGHGLGGIAGLDAKETEVEAPDALEATKRMTLAWLRTALGDDANAWSSACTALKGPAASLGTVVEK